MPQLVYTPERMRKNLSLSQVAAIALLAIFTVFITWRAKTVETRFAEDHGSSALQDKTAPNFSLESLDGHIVALADYKGKKKLIIAYWASWCGPCRLEMPSLRRFYETYHNANSDFEVLAISVDENERAAQAYAQEEKLPFPVLLDPHSQAADAFSVDAIPANFVIGKDGKVTYASTGLDQALEVRLALQLGLKVRHFSAMGGGDDSGH